ncbi:MAG: nucleotidyl transferase AbiEii/AbiGii toxin family protein [Actinomycetota bacterium]
MAFERRLLTRSSESGIGLDRLRRRVLFERIVARLEAAEPGRWVLKGGMALEVRLQDDTRLTKDIDLGLRDDVRPLTLRSVGSAAELERGDQRSRLRRADAASGRELLGPSRGQLPEAAVLGQ